VVAPESELHAAVIRHVAERGFAPSLTTLQTELGWPLDAVQSTLAALAAIRGVILKPNSSDVWGIHPFTLMPTHTWVRTATGAWWANCAWCALGIGAALRRDICVSSRLGAEQQTVEFRVEAGRATDDTLLIHFPFPPDQWWNNPYNPCGAILYFSSAAEVETWCARHGLPRGEIISIAAGVALAREWFGDYLEPTWKRKSPAEARAVFRSLGLNTAFWQGGDVDPITPRH
jgi:hypothetical protein